MNNTICQHKFILLFCNICSNKLLQYRFIEQPNINVATEQYTVPLPNKDTCISVQPDINEQKHVVPLLNKDMSITYIDIDKDKNTSSVPISNSKKEYIIVDEDENISLPSNIYTKLAQKDINIYLPPAPIDKSAEINSSNTDEDVKDANIPSVPVDKSTEIKNLNISVPSVPAHKDSEINNLNIDEDIRDVNMSPISTNNNEMNDNVETTNTNKNIAEELEISIKNHIERKKINNTLFDMVSVYKKLNSISLINFDKDMNEPNIDQDVNNNIDQNIDQNTDQNTSDEDTSPEEVIDDDVIADNTSNNTTSDEASDGESSIDGFTFKSS